MEFGILGPLLVRDEHGEHPVAAPKQRVLLAALLLRHGQVTTAETLADCVWDGRPPRTARSALQNSVMRLRAGLGAAGARLQTRAGGYLLEAAPEEFDLHRFTELHRSGAAALDRRDDEQAVELLEAALAVWRGDALLDVPSDRLHREQAERLADHRLQAMEARVTAELRLRRRSMVAELYALTAAHPGRERFWAQLMTALYQEGRQAEALTVYQRVRRALDEELGILPGAELRELHQRILRADLEPAPVDEPATGHQHRPAPLLPAPRQTPPPLPSRRQAPSGNAPFTPLTPTQLAAPLADFTGRVTELAELTRLLTVQRGTGICATVLSGPAGSGKRTLAGQAARAAQRAFPDGVLRADLRGSRPDPATPHEVLAAFLAALGVPADRLPMAAADRAALFRGIVAGRRLLVVLEDAHNAAQVRPLLPTDTAGAVLVTSRRRLPELIGAVPVALGPLPLPDAVTFLRRAVDPRQLADGPAGSAEPAGDSTTRTGPAGDAATRTELAGDAAALTELAALCDGLPLALRICALRLATRPGWTVRRLADRLVDPRRRLDELRIGELDLRTAFAGALRALDPATAAAFGRLALPGLATVGTRTAAEALGSSAPHAEHLLERLVDAHLLNSRTPGRYRYPALLHLFAREYAQQQDGAAARPSQPLCTIPRC
ncbi:DNA-binding SARP family transcriptional activator/RecA/RadA recombinase [Kitasatospora sp. GP30]|uniref:AfsR/SARP family transcriptional regulator n=1 Tax=Kitasatospora sp. GP30 TaxID=3035084 RepID=UPI000C714F5C|nr:AfsR/SARP family transcriptional regulator [Kitasatospora sp. GP30]MDH6139718.1 DNA-binding SARP family transcriptional activator/RecA/RadA recombinase [Kitasatospora sp. GP30]